MGPILLFDIAYNAYIQINYVGDIRRRHSHPSLANRCCYRFEKAKKKQTDKIPVSLNNSQLLQALNVKYLGMHLDRCVTWLKHIVRNKKMLGRRSHIYVNNKFLVYTTIFEPIWTYGIQLWGTASNLIIEIVKRFQVVTQGNDQ